MPKNIPSLKPKELIKLLEQAGCTFHREGKRFLKELAALPVEIQSRVEPIVFQELESENPFELGYLEKLKGYSDKYKIRGSIYCNIQIMGDRTLIPCQA